MNQTARPHFFPDLPSYLQALRAERDLLEITAEVDPELELAEIHRRVIAERGPALLFSAVRSSSWPVVTNLFGTEQRVRLAFGDEPRRLIEKIASLPETLLPPSWGKLWAQRSLFFRLGRIGTVPDSAAFVVQRTPDLVALPALRTWPADGGPFLTLPLVYTEDPLSGVHNLGIYRLQRFDCSRLGFHVQIAKGAGFHLSRAKACGAELKVNVFLGGPPAVMLSAVAPLPENVPELLFASLVHGARIRLAKNPVGPLPLLATAEFVLVGSVPPTELHPEGPFGDHYGYYSLQHDYPVFHCHALLHRRKAIYPATVVGKPRQEDFFIGNYLQESLAPLFPLVMPGVKRLWSYGECGFHPLAAAVVADRYKREALVHAFRILGEGQLALTKFLLVTDCEVDLQKFPLLLEHILERAQFETDLYILSNLSMDTLDYTGPRINEGSKGILLGIGEKRRELPRIYSGSLPRPLTRAVPFCGGCLAVSGPSWREDQRLAERLAAASEFSSWPLVALVDDAARSARDQLSFLWSVFTRFEPAADLFSRAVTLERYHPSLTAPLVIDARMKPSYPAEVECDAKTAALVNRRWREYFPRGLRS